MSENTTIGLKTHIWNNNLRSIFLLGMFPMLFIFMLWAGGFLLGMTSIDTTQIPTIDPSIYNPNRGQELYVAYGDKIAVFALVAFVILVCFKLFTFLKINHKHKKTNHELVKKEYKSLILFLFIGVIIVTLTAFIAQTLCYTVIPTLESDNLTFLPAIQQGNDLVNNYALFVFIGISIWFAIAYFFNQSMINKSTGAHSLSKSDAPEIYNMLENLCISRGIKTPNLFIIESEGLNAYASGINEKTYSVTLTRGIIDKLNKEELEGVIAHELTHILNKDVRLLIVSIIFVGIISFLAQLLIRNMMYGGRRRSNSKDGGKLIIVAFVVLAIGYLFAILIRFALSRSREYMADAGAVELTKNPLAMASALEKISGKSEVTGTGSEVKQMFIENPPMFAFMQTGLFSIFATHPPIDKRIDILRKMA